MGNSAAMPTNAVGCGCVTSEANDLNEVNFWKQLLNYEKDQLIPPLGATDHYSLGIIVNERKSDEGWFGAPKRFRHSALVVVPRGQSKYKCGFTLELVTNNKTPFLRPPLLIKKKTRKKRGEHEEIEHYVPDLISDTQSCEIIIRKMKAIVLVTLAIDIIREHGSYGKFTDNCRHFVSQMKLRWRNEDLSFEQSPLWERCKSYHDDTLNPFMYMRIPFWMAVEAEDMHVVKRFGLAFLASPLNLLGAVGEIATEPCIGSSVYITQKYFHKNRSRDVKKNDGAIVPRFYWGKKQFPDGVEHDWVFCYYCGGTPRVERREDLDALSREAARWFCVRCYKVPKMLRHCENESCKSYDLQYCDECSMTKPAESAENPSSRESLPPEERIPGESLEEASVMSD